MTGARWITSKHAGVVVALASVTVLVAACGGSGGSKVSNQPPPNPYSHSGGSGGSGGAAGAAAKMTIGTARGSAGAYLVGASGRALYLWVADSNGQSVCSGACAKVWPPVLASATPAVAGGVNARDLGWATRAGGQKQVTYNGHPLYYFIADHGAGKTTGQGSNSFGAKWWLVSPSGASITKPNSATG